MKITRETLQQMRIDSGVTQSDLADVIGVSQSYIAKLENGTLDPKLSIVNRIIDTISLKREPRCSDLMTANPSTVNARDTVSFAVDIMKRRGFSQLPVMRGRTVIGLITESDILRNYTFDLEKISVESIMSPSGVPVLDEDTPVSSVLSLFQIFQAIVVQKRGRITGIVTRSDLLREKS